VKDITKKFPRKSTTFILKGGTPMKRFMEKIDNLLMASVMAEANAHDLGREYLQSNKSRGFGLNQNLQDFLRTVGLDNVQVYYGVAKF
jgi:inhibitor of KinA sporulation pathway (predicted exonuclease)